MIWFGKLSRIFEAPVGFTLAPGGDDATRMEQALRWVAARAPQLEGAALLDALAGTGWVDRATAARLLPAFRGFDADRVFAESLRSLSLRGDTAADEFRARVGRVVEDLTGDARLDALGPEQAIRFCHGERQGVVLAYPQVSFTLGGSAMKAVTAAIEELPDTLVIVARNFAEGAEAQLRSVLDRSELPGTLVTVNLLLGMRAIALKYQPSPDRVIDLLGAGGALRSRDIAALGDR
jgi:hypothetical protein